MAETDAATAAVRASTGNALWRNEFGDGVVISRRDDAGDVPVSMVRPDLELSGVLGITIGSSSILSKRVPPSP
mgnify:CR=1 FL=1